MHLVISVPRGLGSSKDQGYTCSSNIQQWSKTSLRNNFEITSLFLLVRYYIVLPLFVDSIVSYSTSLVLLLQIVHFVKPIWVPSDDEWISFLSPIPLVQLQISSPAHLYNNSVWPPILITLGNDPLNHWPHLQHDTSILCWFVVWLGKTLIVPQNVVKKAPSKGCKQHLKTLSARDFPCI
jgi:hypothetical protein